MKKVSRLLVWTCLFVFVCMAAGCKPERKNTPEKLKMMWIDASANYQRFSNKDSIDFYLRKLKEKGFTHAIVDIRPISGYVLFDSDLATNLFDATDVRHPDFDYLGEFIKAGHQLGMSVFASMNVFAGGNTRTRKGIMYDNHREWASIEYTPQGIRSILDQKDDYNGMINPCDTVYQAYFISLLNEMLNKYPQLDGIMFDRVRYNGISTDFSERSEKCFEKYLGKKVERFPEDIFRWEKYGTTYNVAEGKYFKQWISWRADVIYDFMKKLKTEIKSVNPHIKFADYTGAWYPLYYKVGVNFASNTFDPGKLYSWADSDYAKTGYAELLDVFSVGNYYTDITLKASESGNHDVWIETDKAPDQNSWYSVEGSCRNLRKIMGGKPFIGGVLVSQFYDNPEKITQSIDANLKYSDGVMVFDISHIITHHLWDRLP